MTCGTCVWLNFGCVTCHTYCVRWPTLLNNQAHQGWPKSCYGVRSARRSYFLPAVAQSCQANDCHRHSLQRASCSSSSPAPRSKIAMSAHTRVCARAHPQVHVNAMCPGWCKTDMAGTHKRAHRLNCCISKPILQDGSDHLRPLLMELTLWAARVCTICSLLHLRLFVAGLPAA